jgi:hypothetical protein
MPLVPKLIFVMEEGGQASQLPYPPSFGGAVDPGFGVGGIPHPGHGLPGQGGQGLRPGNALPPVPPQVPVTKPSPPTAGTHPLPLPALPQGSFILVWAPGHGWVGVALDPNAPGVDNTLPSGPPEHPSGQPVQPGAAPQPAGRR